jgi:MFS family permease
VRVRRTHRSAVSDRRLIACLTLDALCGATVSGLGSPLVPDIVAVHGVSFEAAQWVLTVTLVVGAVTVPVVSRLGDGRRRRLVLVGALGCVALGALLAALVFTFPALLLGRALQGLGYGLVPLTIGVAREHLCGDVLRRAVAMLSVSVAVGAGLANPLTGLFVYYFDYRAAFVFGAVLAAVAAAWTLRLLPDDHERSGGVSVDVSGALWLGGGLGCGLLAVSRGETWGWTSRPVLGLACASVALLAVCAVIELRTSEPLVDLRLACSPTLLGVNLTAVFTGAAVFGGMSLVFRVSQAPLDAPAGLGQPLFVAGLLMMPMSVGSLVAPSMARRVARRLGVGVVLPLGSVFVAVSYLFFSVAHDKLWQIAVVTFGAGVGIGIAYSIMPALILARAPAERTSSATGVNTVLRITGGAMGSAVIATVLAIYTPAGTTFPSEAGYVAAAVLAAGLCLASFVVSAVLVRSVPARPEHRIDDRPDVAALMQESVAEAAGALPAYGDTGVPASPRSPVRDR